MSSKPVAIRWTTVPVDPEPIGEAEVQLKDLLWEFYEHPVKPVVLTIDDPVTYYLRGVRDATKRDPDLRKQIDTFLATVRQHGAIRLVVEPQPPP